MIYKQNFISNVILRIDFANPIEDLKSQVKFELTKLILNKFPIQEKNLVQSQNVIFNNGNVSSEHSQLMEWKYFGKSREKNLILNVDSLILDYKEYTSFKDFSDDVIEIIDSLFQNYTVQIRRIGLRYVNMINDRSGDTFNWAGKINEDLTQNINFFSPKEYFSRLVSIMEFNLDGDNLRFQYGMFNPQFPSKIKEKVFMLDYDYYSEAYIDSSQEVKDFIQKGNTAISEMFEKSIGDELRKEMEKGE